MPSGSMPGLSSKSLWPACFTNAASGPLEKEGSRSDASNRALTLTRRTGNVLRAGEPFIPCAEPSGTIALLFPTFPTPSQKRRTCTHQSPAQARGLAKPHRYPPASGNTHQKMHLCDCSYRQSCPKSKKPVVCGENTCRDARFPAHDALRSPAPSHGYTHNQLAVGSQ